MEFIYIMLIFDLNNIRAFGEMNFTFIKIVSFNFHPHIRMVVDCMITGHSNC